ncbi:MAG TPA: hypothetical protein VGI75_06500 [Pirellulales bacterium]
MNETSKTFSLIIAAVAVLCLAFVTRPAPQAAVNPAVVGKSLFASLDDPAKAKRMKIVTFDEATSQPREFEVAQVNGVWSLPSHKNYPADAKEQFAAAASALFDLKVLGTVGGKGTQEEQALYGVLEPKPGEDQFGEHGIGKLVVIEDENAKPLARLIIGKQDKPNKPDEMGMGNQSQLRFVRIPGQDQIYRVQMASDKFSTNFADWIETDLLKMSPWDINEIKLRDYSVVDTMTRSGELNTVLDQRSDADLTFDDKTQKWMLKDLVNYKDEKPKVVKLAEDEELNSIKLNDLKNALGQLKIVDVARKPAEMSVNLKADKDFITDADSLRDLKRHGFRPIPVGDSYDIVSNDGEAVVSMKDGVEYVLRFGAVAGIDTGADDSKKADGKTADAKTDADKSESADADAKKDKNGGLSRYVMVMARFNPEMVPKPELDQVPEIKKPSDKSAKAAGKKTDAKSDTDKKDANKNDTDKKSDADKKADAKAADSKVAEAKKDTAKKDTAKTGDAKSAEAKAAADKANESKDSEPKTDAKSGADDDLEAEEAEHDRLEKENHKKQDAYDEKIKQGEHKAKELNARFADWYYVVGEDTYKKIHLSQSDLIKKKPADDKNAKDGKAAAAPPANPFNLTAPPAGKPTAPAAK